MQLLALLCARQCVGAEDGQMGTRHGPCPLGELGLARGADRDW